MKDEYIIINKTKWLEVLKNSKKPAPHWDGVYVSDAQNARAELIEEILSKSTPLIPLLEDAFDRGSYETLKHYDVDDKSQFLLDKQKYINNLKLNI